MLRKSLFGGLTLMLCAVLVWLVINGRKEESRLAAGPAEIVQTAKTSSTRVMAPGDLEVTESRAGIPTGSAQRIAIGRIAISNRGKISYHDVMLRISCLGSGGSVLNTQNRLVEGTIQPGQTLTVDDIVVADPPRGAVRCTVSILYSDLGPAPKTAP